MFTGVQTRPSGELSGSRADVASGLRVYSKMLTEARSALMNRRAARWLLREFLQRVNRPVTHEGSL